MMIKQWLGKFKAWIIALVVSFPLAFGGGFGLGVKTTPEKIVEVEKVVETVVEKSVPIAPIPMPTATTVFKETIEPKSSEWCQNVKVYYDKYKWWLSEEQMLYYAKQYGYTDEDEVRARACLSDY